MKKFKRPYTIYKGEITIMLNIIYKLSDHSYIDKDIEACGWNNFADAYKNHKPFRNIFLFRLLQQNKTLFRIARILCRPQDGIEINVTTGKIGKGFTIWHGYGTVIYCREIGENCQICQGATIGRGKNINGVDIPKIGNNVSIYTNAVVIGGIEVGDNVKIGANAVVNADVPDNCTVVGNPMRIIQHYDIQTHRKGC